MRILLVVGRSPQPARRGDQLRTGQTVDALAGRHLVTVLAPGPGGRAPSGVPRDAATAELVTYRRRPLATRLPALLATLPRGLPLQSGIFHHPDLTRRLRDLVPRHDLVILQLARLAAHRDALAGAPLVTDLVDALSLNFRTRSAVDLRLLGPVWRWEASRLLAAEESLLAASRRAVVVCDRDRSFLAAELPSRLAARLGVVPMAMAAGAPPSPTAGRPPVLALTGNLGYFANRDGARWFLRRVWPRLRGERPDLRLLLAGQRPPRWLRHLAERHQAELVVDPADLRSLLRQSRVALAPIRAGSGVPLKVLEAWAEGVPVVASPWAAAGAGGRADHDLLVAETPEGWHEAILRLLDDRELAESLAAAGREKLARDHSGDRVTQAWEEVVGC